MNLCFFFQSLRWGGPLSQNWLDQQLALQKKILSRMIELGMVPVLPSFSGNVPAVFSKLFPSANITRLGDWNTVDADPRWCCTYLLGPSDALFIEVGQAFIKQQIKEYGDVTNIYNWYFLLICIFGISPECIVCSLSFACWITRLCYQMLSVEWFIFPC